MWLNLYGGSALSIPIYPFICLFLITVPVFSQQQVLFMDLSDTNEGLFCPFLLGSQNEWTNAES